MTKAKEQELMNIALDHLDYELETYVQYDFVEVTGKKGGDVLTFRVYLDGSIYER